MMRRLLSRLARAKDSLTTRSLGLEDRFHTAIIRHTNNFGSTTWLGRPIWQNVFDLWVIQETIAEIKPDLLVETGTNRGGSSLFYAHLFDLMGHGQIITVDVQKLHDLSHPRVTYLIGDSAGEAVLGTVRRRAAEVTGPVMVILDSDHSEAHVRRELEAYAPLVTPGSFLMVQDGVIDVLPMLAADCPGPLPAINDFLLQHPEYELDVERCRRFLITHHPKGWLRRKPGS
ncbi:MAG: Rhamnosyl O-methyltransferase precursor [Gemmataceae bacterium]|nr:Rhamnosyl O-methyltransferase precursor [Gemmataceae bacterium]